MSFDDGNPDGFDSERVKARLKTTLRSEKIGFEKLCEDADVTPSEALRALDIGSDGFPMTLNVLQKLSVALGRGPDWLPFGTEDQSIDREQEATRIERLVWEFIYKADLKDSDKRAKLLTEALSPLAQYAAGSSPRFRRKLVRTLKDVVRLFQELFPNSST